MSNMEGGTTRIRTETRLLAKQVHYRYAIAPRWQFIRMPMHPLFTERRPAKPCVRREGFEPPNLSELIYSQSALATCITTHVTYVLHLRVHQ